MEIEENPLSKLTADQIHGLLGTLLVNDNEEWASPVAYLGDVPANFDARVLGSSTFYPN